jgi:hypothetical protein
MECGLAGILRDVHSEGFEICSAEQTFSDGEFMEVHESP